MAEEEEVSNCTCTAESIGQLPLVVSRLTLKLNFSLVFVLRRVICGVMAEQLNNLLWKNCKFGKVEEVREALQAGADPNTTRGILDDTCLMVAAYYNHDEVLALLLAAGADVNAKSNYNRTALRKACSSGSLASLTHFPQTISNLTFR